MKKIFTIVAVSSFVFASVGFVASSAQAAPGHCGANADSYGSNITDWPSVSATSFCSTGNLFYQGAQGTTPPFPAVNASVTWGCAGTGTETGQDVNCSATRGTTSGSTTGTLTPDYLFGGNALTADQVQTATGLGSRDPRTIAASVINVILGFLGIIAVVLIIVGGFMWMTAAGNDEKIATARKIMVAGVIGLVIVLAAFGIARFVVNALVGATTTAG